MNSVNAGTENIFPVKDLQDVLMEKAVSVLEEEMIFVVKECRERENDK